MLYAASNREEAVEDVLNELVAGDADARGLRGGRPAVDDPRRPHARRSAQVRRARPLSGRSVAGAPREGWAAISSSPTPVQADAPHLLRSAPAPRPVAGDQPSSAAIPPDSELVDADPERHELESDDDARDRAPRTSAPGRGSSVRVEQPPQREVHLEDRQALKQQSSANTRQSRAGCPAENASTDSRSVGEPRAPRRPPRSAASTSRPSAATRRHADGEHASADDHDSTPPTAAAPSPAAAISPTPIIVTADDRVDDEVERPATTRPHASPGDGGSGRPSSVRWRSGRAA